MLTPPSVPPGGPKPWENNAPANTVLPQQGNPIVQAVPVAPVLDSVSVSVADTVRFGIAIRDRRWAKYKAALPQFKFDSGEWTTLTRQDLSRKQLEQHLYDVLNERYQLAQASFREKCQPLIAELAQAAYVANQPSATLRQKNAYVILHAKDGPILDQSSGPLMATRILLDSIQDDLKSQSDSGL